MDGRQSWYPDGLIFGVNDDRDPILDEARNAKSEDLMTRFAQPLQLFEGSLLASRHEFVSLKRRAGEEQGLHCKALAQEPETWHDDE